MSRHAELSDDEDVERCVESFSYFKRNGDSTTGQRQHDDIVPARVVNELRSELGACFTAIGERTMRSSEHSDTLPEG
jgi:hypothetical protein